MRISDWSSDVCSSDLMVFQHFSLFDTLTVAENIALGLPKDMRLDALEGRIADMARQYGLDLEPPRHVHTRPEEHTSEPQSLIRSPYAVLCSQTKTQLIITSLHISTSQPHSSNTN